MTVFNSISSWLDNNVFARLEKMMQYLAGDIPDYYNYYNSESQDIDVVIKYETE